MNQRTEELQRSVGDNILQPSFKILVNILSHFISRVALALSLLPIYILVKFLTILPTTVRNARFLLSEGGRDRLICLSDLYRASETKQAEDQLSGAFRFEKHQLLQDGQARGWLGAVKWSPHVELFEMEGARVNFVHEQPGKGQRHSGKKIILLHGNPSWSFMWRNVCIVILLPMLKFVPGLILAVSGWSLADICADVLGDSRPRGKRS